MRCSDYGSRVRGNEKDIVHYVEEHSQKIKGIKVSSVLLELWEIKWSDLKTLEKEEHDVLTPKYKTGILQMMTSEV